MAKPVVGKVANAVATTAPGPRERRNPLIVQNSAVQANRGGPLACRFFPANGGAAATRAMPAGESIILKRCLLLFQASNYTLVMCR